VAGVGFETRELTVQFPNCVALADFDIAIAPGERIAFVGPSGAGKTTLLRILNGTLRPTIGRVLVEGRDLAARSARGLRALRASIGVVPQDLALIPNVRVAQNVISGRIGRMSLVGALREFLWPREGTLERVHSLLCRVGIGEKIFIRTDRLSGGQRQRVAIARALFQEPLAILADEPVSSVDPSRARDTVELLSAISRDDDITLCMSLHNVDLAREFFPRLIGMRHGRVVFDRPSEEVTPADVDALYSLSRAEMLADGA
jgi:phosphonate transport system ATP-binding protein